MNRFVHNKMLILALLAAASFAGCGAAATAGIEAEVVETAENIDEAAQTIPVTEMSNEEHETSAVETTLAEDEISATETTLAEDEISAAETIAESDDLPGAPLTMEIYDIDEGFVTVPYLPELPHHAYDWDKLEKEGQYWSYADEQILASHIGVDVSKYQGDVDWKKVAADQRIEFAIIRQGFRGYETGKLALDSKFEQNIQGAQEAGLEVGVYFFSQAISEEEAVEEADFICDSIADYKIKGPVVYDSEKVKGQQYQAQELRNEERTDLVIAFCEQVKERGYTPMLYANSSWLTTSLELERLTDYAVWYADYEEKPIYPYWFEMLQYTNTATIDGIPGYVDLNLYFEQKK